MNRLSTFEGFSNLQSGSYSARRMSRECAIAERGVCHSVFVPMHYECNYAYPLVVWLHGSGKDERQLERIAPHLSLRNYVAVAPRGTRAEIETDSHQHGYTWRQHEDDILLAEQRVIDCIELATQRFNIARHRVFVIGAEAGGTMALRIALACPELFAGAASIGGPFPEGNNPLVRVEQSRALPLLLAHGRESTTYAEEQVCRDLRLIHAAGISVTLRQYPDGDNIGARMLRDVDGWIMEHVTGDSSSHPQRRYVDLN